MSSGAVSSGYGKFGERWQRVAARLRTRRGVATLLLAAAALGASCAFAFHFGVAPAFRSGDGFEYALMGRRLAEGEGFTTGVIYPAELWLGADARHPAVRLPPFWPLLLAGPFALFGAEAGVAHATLVALCGVLVALAAALAGARGGLVAGGVAALAAATSHANLLLALEPDAHTIFACAVALVLLLCALPAPAFLVGLACGIAYLTRYSGVLLLPAALALVFARRREARSLAACGAGFLAVAAPWWIRNLLVAGDPFYSLLELTPWSARAPTVHSTLPFQQQPDFASQFATDPLVKIQTNLSTLLRYLPFANANLAACAGLLLGCLRRDAFCLAFAAIAALALVAAACAEPVGGELAPYFPALLALGAAAWLRHGGRLRAPALALLLLAPVLPSLPGELQDLRQLRISRAILLRTHEGEPPPEVRDALRRCLEDRPLVIAQAAPRIAWQADAIAIYAPLWPQEFWRIVEEQPVAFAQQTALGDLSAERFEAEFEPRSECAPDLYARRKSPR